MNVTHIPPDCPNVCCGPVNEYAQCKLERRVGELTFKLVSWIPAEFASAGKVVRLKNGSLWEGGWTVVSVGKKKFGRDSTDEMCGCGA